MQRRQRKTERNIKRRRKTKERKESTKFGKDNRYV